MSSKKTKPKHKLRSADWLDSRRSSDGITCRNWVHDQGIPEHFFEGKPIIGICNTWSELTPCNSQLRQVAEKVKRGVYEAGGIPLEFPVFSSGEANLRPTAMLTRNLVSMDVEESIRGNPVDGVVLLAGCDKTTPALLMGAASCNLPTIVVSAGPVLNDNRHSGGFSSAIVQQIHRQYGSGNMASMHPFMSAEIEVPKAGTCNSMGTASTMACMAEAMGVALPHNATIPAVDPRRYVLAHVSGERIVQMVNENMTLDKILTPTAFYNAIQVNAAIGGSTNVVIHLKAIAQRIGVSLSLDDWQKYGKNIPMLLNVKPSGEYLMEDFYYAGGLPVILRRLGENNMLYKPALTVTGKTIWENNKNAECFNDNIIHPLDKPILKNGGICVLKGNLAPRGAVLKISAASKELLKHRGKAVVFENFEHYKNRIADPDLAVDASSVLVMKNCGPKGFPGMGEVGNMTIPPKLAAQGIQDMIRISDARMSAIGPGTMVLHVAPEAMELGPIAIVQDGDMIELDAEKGLLHLDIPNKELAQRLEKLKSTHVMPRTGGYLQLYMNHVLQADEGCDFDFLVGCRGSAVTSHSHQPLPISTSKKPPQ